MAVIDCGSISVCAEATPLPVVACGTCEQTPASGGGAGVSAAQASKAAAK